MPSAWTAILAEGARAFEGEGHFPLRAYSEFMPPPWVGAKPYAPGVVLAPPIGDDGLDVSEYEEQQELRPGLLEVATHLLGELGKLFAGAPHAFSRTLLEGNPAFAPEVARGDPVVVLPLALSRTQDDKGRVRWTLFGASHLGPSRALWRSLDAAGFCALAGWLCGEELPDLRAAKQAGFRVLPRGADPDFPSWGEQALPYFTRPLVIGEGARLDSVRTVLTFRPFARWPASLRAAHAEGRVRVVPSPASLAFAEDPKYRRLAPALRWAMQVPLLHLFPRSRSTGPLRIPQSGWLDEKPVEHAGDTGGHRMVRGIARRHRWQRVERDQADEAEEFLDHVARVLFDTDADVLGLYGKPMARNAQVWDEAYAAVLDGPRANRAELDDAARRVLAGGRYGYRFFFPPMRVLERSLFWHRPLVARRSAAGAVEVFGQAPLGLATAERDGSADLELPVRRLERDGHREASRLVSHEPGRLRGHTSANARKLLELGQMLGGLLPESLARSLLYVARESTLERWLDEVRGRSAPLAAHLKALLSPEPPLGAALALERMATREFEEKFWGLIAGLSSGHWRETDNADAIETNAGRTGGPRAAEIGRTVGHHRDLDALAEHLVREHRALVEKQQMAGRAEVLRQLFRWDTDFEFPWSDGWRKNQRSPAEQNVVAVIPGRNRREAVVMADHYDTAYMEDLYEPRRGGDRLRAAAAGADDNHSATAALMLAAEVLLPLSREGKLERDVWLVHLTGEEFPSDCLGARALAQALVERTVRFSREDGSALDVSGVEVRGAYVLDMIAHNNDKARDVFQISPGEGAGSARLAAIAHEATRRWNALAERLNEGRRGLGRAKRISTPEPPPPFEHLVLHDEVRPEWEARSSLYNTDGQIFSDVGVPVVLLMENYDIKRSGYHDTRDTLDNIDLDYGAALCAIAIESVAAAAS